MVALIYRPDRHHRWAAAKAERFPPPWVTCEAVVSEAFHLLDIRGRAALVGVLRRRAVISVFRLDEDTEQVLRLMEKYADVPMSFADGCLVRMTEKLPDPVLLTTDSDFRVYRRNSRQAIPCEIPD
ncbi:MAG TPA: PIN domain-containing protein [Vineibacter sp.]|nr:PIN domain-containing protein [Vineibacter sp.]